MVKVRGARGAQPPCFDLGPPALPPDPRYRLALRALHAFRQINICHYATVSALSRSSSGRYVR